MVRQNAAHHRQVVPYIVPEHSSPPSLGWICALHGIVRSNDIGRWRGKDERASHRVGKGCGFADAKDATFEFRSRGTYHGDPADVIAVAGRLRHAVALAAED
jgi:hypothetical protein